MKSTQGLAILVVAGLAASASAHPTYQLGRGEVKVNNGKMLKSTYGPVTDLMPFSDNFDSYTLGAGITSVGNGWAPWPGAPATAVVSNVNSVSPPHSMSTMAFSDDVQTSTPGQITSGKWKLSAKVFMPASAAGTGGGTLIGLDKFQTVFGSNHWAVQISFDSTLVGAGLIGNGGPNSVNQPMVFDKWIPTEIYIDLDADTVWAQVDTGAGFVKVIDPPSPWSAGSSGPGGQLAIECWDFYSSGAVGFLFDDINFGPDAPACYPDCDGDSSLTIDDFICFQTFFALNDPYADCDGDSSLTIDDFICFQTFFAIGC